MGSDEEWNGISEMDTELLGAEDLLKMGMEQLDELFTGGAAPVEQEMQGMHRPLFIAFPARPLMPKKLLGLWAALSVSPINPWKEAEFTVDSECNCTLLAGIKSFYSEVSAGVSEFDGADCMILDYDIGRNPFFIRIFKDEIRKINDGLYLGRGNLATGGQMRLVCYFSLEPDI